MKKLKKQKGITLVALIITIVVLLILAVVAIGAVQDSQIIGHAQNAASRYNTSKGEEENKITDAENLLDKYAPTADKKPEYLEGTDLRINATYYMSGKNNAESSFIAYDDGTGVITEGEKITELTYTVENGKVIVTEMPGMEVTIIKESNNDILILESTNSIDLMATSTNGLKYFNGEKYQFDNEGYLERIILNENGSEIWSRGWGGSISDTIPVFYNGQVYCAYMYDADTNAYEITSTDNCETMICKGNTFTKVQE